MMRAQRDRCRWALAAVMAIAIVRTASAYVTFGQGYASKWGDDPHFGTGAVVTWGFMLDGTPAHASLPAYPELEGTSQIGALRASIDAAYGAGAFDDAILNSFATWSAVANITFVGPIEDTGLPAGQPGATTPDIRIGAFHAVPESGFSFVGAIGYGPPGIITPEYDFPESGDIFFNLDAGFQIAPGDEDTTPINWWLGNDLEGLFLHELGHAAFGLGHPPWAEEDPDQRVMYVGDWTNSNAPWCCETINRQLHADDIAGAQYVYGIRGDFNRDGRVDAADYVDWRKAIGSSVTRGTGADTNIDGMVDEIDYEIWAAQFGNVVFEGFGEQMWNFGAVAVPEPATWGLALLLAMSWFLCGGMQSGRAATAAAKQTRQHARAATPDTVQPAPQDNPLFMAAHRDLLAKAKAGVIDVYFLGDSITRRWHANDYPELQKNWRQNFFGWNAANFGWGGDRTENVLWRLANGELDGVNPKVVVLMIGTNNIGDAPAVNDTTSNRVVRDIRAIVDAIENKAPGAKIVLMGITPRNANGSTDAMPTINCINRRLARFADGQRITHLNINDKLADGDGKLYQGVTDDGLHLSLEGYQIWADALKPLFTEWLGLPAKTDQAPPPTGIPTESAFE